MAGYRDRFIYGLSKGISLIPFNLLRKVSRQKGVLPFYHAVSNEDLPHIKHLYAVRSIEQFKADLDFLLKHFEAIDIHEFIRRRREGIKKSKPYFLLSFDDGLHEFKSVIAPILKEKGVPGLCFLNSGFIDNQGLFYRYKASLLIEELTNNPQRISHLKEHGLSENWKEQILNISYAQQGQLNKWAEQIGLNFNKFLEEQKPYLQSKEIRQLIDDGFHFGAHSIDHPLYHQIGEEEQVRQSLESTRFVRSEFNLDYSVFSFPFTDYAVKRSYFEKTSEYIDMSFGTAGQKTDDVPGNVQRIPFDMSGLSGEEILKAEMMYFVLKKPLGKTRIHRRD